MKTVLRKYKSFFKNLYSWTFATAVCHFVLFLLAFLLLCFSFSLMEIPKDYIDSVGNNLDFVSKFEKYLVLTSAILLLIPFLLSLILTFALLHKHLTLLDVWIKASLGFSSTFTVGLLSSGIYLSVESSYIGYAAIPISLLFAALMIHSILLVYILYTDYKNEPKGDVEIDKEESSTASNE